MEPLKLFIGFDQVESVAFYTLVHSIQSRASIPVSIIPVNTANFRHFYQRDRDPKQSNDFSFSRFLVPYLCNYRGYAVFMDCDMLFRCDAVDLLKQIESMKNNNEAVRVVKHDYKPNDQIKYLGTVQYEYPRKNWSSFVVWNCSHESNLILTPTYVKTASGLDLHRFNWLLDSEIGELPVVWNWLVGEYVLDPAIKDEIKNVHFTVGGPYFSEYAHVDFADEWFEERAMMTYCQQRGRTATKVAG